jgi:hypothetical protein
MTRVRTTALAVAVLIVALMVWHPARVAGQSLLLLPSMFPSAPVDPLTVLTAAPRRTSHAFDYSVGSIRADIFHPAGGGKHGAIVLLLGIGDLPRSDLAVRFAEGLARLGVVVMLPEQSGLLAQRLTIDEVDGLRACFELVAAQEDVDSSRVGFVGLSAAGGLSIVAAASPELRDRVRFVNSFGSYYDGSRLLLDVASRSIEVDGVVSSWHPEVRTLEVIAIAVIDGFSSSTDRDVLHRAFVAHELVADEEWLTLSEDGQQLRELLAGTTSRARAAQLIDGLPTAARERLNQVSPSRYLQTMRTRLFVMHDEGDTFIPFTESRHLTSAAPPGVVQRFTEFSIFAHVTPDKPVPWQTFLPDLWRLYWHVHAVLLEVL